MQNLLRQVPQSLVELEIARLQLSEDAFGVVLCSNLSQEVFRLVAEALHDVLFIILIVYLLERAMLPVANRQILDEDANLAY